jgi:predicted Rossmann fold nucleotide-binding protein DprA/Smf involved in DNA uptake
VLSTDQLLDNLSGQMTAKQLADRSGITVREAVLGLCTLQEEGRVLRKVDAEGSPVVRWRAVGP